jgi:acetyl esterase
MCRSLCRGAGCLVQIVDYCLAPEHPFPAGLEDCYATTCWMATHAAEFHGDPARIAGWWREWRGNFAASIALISRDRGGPDLMFQLLLCPAADFRLTTASWKDYDGYMFTREEFLIVRDFYVPHEEERVEETACPREGSLRAWRSQASQRLDTGRTTGTTSTNCPPATSRSQSRSC